MKKLLVTIILISLFSLPKTYAATATPTPSPKPTSESVTEKLSNQINDLKEKIASRVAQLKLVEKKGILGSVKDASSTQMTITDISGANRVIDVDEITKFSSPSAKDSFGISDIKPGMKLSVIGLYNKDSQRLLARFVNSFTIPLYLSGAITNVDKENYTVTLQMEGGKSYLVDIESVTKTLDYSTIDSPVKSGFSKIENGTRAVIIGYADKKQANRMVATRILIFPNLPKNPLVVVAPNALNQGDQTVSSGSGKKLTPLR